MPRHRVLVAYDGTDFLGWQTQSGNGRTVQEELERCLSTVLRETIRVEAAGRTDTGVHARGQVIAFDLGSDIPDVARALYSLNSVLPSEVQVADLREASPDFDPRRQAGGAQLNTQSSARFPSHTSNVVGRVWNSHNCLHYKNQAHNQVSISRRGNH